MGYEKLNMAKIRRESIRWLIISALDNLRPNEAHELMLLPIVKTIFNDVSNTELRREVDYLQKRRVVNIQKSSHGWIIELSALGIDIFEYTVSCRAGIARP